MADSCNPPGPARDLRTAPERCRRCGCRVHHRTAPEGALPGRPGSSRCPVRVPQRPDRYPVARAIPDRRIKAHRHRAGHPASLDCLPAPAGFQHGWLDTGRKGRSQGFAAWACRRGAFRTETPDLQSASDKGRSALTPTMARASANRRARLGALGPGGPVDRPLTDRARSSRSSPEPAAGVCVHRRQARVSGAPTGGICRCAR